MSRSYSIEPGFFVQDAPEADISSFGALPPHFGLFDDSPERWEHLKKRIASLNEHASSGTTYKLIYLGRHGQGHHNVALEHYGREAWDEHYSKLTGDGDMTWGPDPPLTPLGIEQALSARSSWREEIPFGIPLPDACYVSPLQRALQTWGLIYNGNEDSTSVLPLARRRVTILENLREAYGLHPCDKRSTCSAIARNFPPPTYEMEQSLTEDDLLWMQDERESFDHVALRARRVLDTIFDGPAVYVSLTAHAGLLRFGILKVLSRGPHRLPTGGILPLVVKGEVAHGRP